MKPKDANFVVARLSDNDFNDILKASLEAICPIALSDKDCTEDTIKQALILHMVGLSMCRTATTFRLEYDLSYYQSLEAYFEGRIKLTFDKHRPDANGYESAYFDVNLGQSFLF